MKEKSVPVLIRTPDGIIVTKATRNGLWKLVRVERDGKKDLEFRTSVARRCSELLHRSVRFTDITTITVVKRNGLCETLCEVTIPFDRATVMGEIGTWEKDIDQIFFHEACEKLVPQDYDLLTRRGKLESPETVAIRQLQQRE